MENGLYRMGKSDQWIKLDSTVFRRIPLSKAAGSCGIG